MTGRPDALGAWHLQRKQDMQRNRPAVLLSDTLHRHEKAAACMMQGLQERYAECLLSGRLDVWQRAAASAVELLASVHEIKFERHIQVVRETLRRAKLNASATDDFDQLLEEAAVEIERLRAALEYCAKDSYFDDVAHEYLPTESAQHARRALNQQSGKPNE